MRVVICAVGRLRSGPEKYLIDDYLSRFDKTGRALGLGAAQVAEVGTRKSGSKQEEAAQLQRVIPAGAVVCALDERGKSLSSPDFARKLAAWREDGRADLALLIGGADGLDPGLLKTADFTMSFGAMVWPHMLVRVMLAEQLYRAATILSGGPYHRV